MQDCDSNAEDQCNDNPATADEILQQTNKRLTLNLLIQGAGMHTFLTAHHLVRDELEAIRPGLTNCYDRMIVSVALNYFIGDIPLIYGLPSRFWNRTHRPSHPFYRHRLLASHGHELWRESKRFLLERARKKRVIRIPGFAYGQMVWLVEKVAWVERKQRAQLARLAEFANSLIWGIDQSRLEAALTANVAFGHLQNTKTVAERLTRSGVIGYGGLEWRDGQFKVVAKAWNWPLVLHELTKGTAELICLHGLNSLDDETYHAVTHQADQLEYEKWLLQAGSEMWRRLLAAIPEDRKLPHILMHCARLAPMPLERLMLAVVEDPTSAKTMLRELG